MVGLVANNISAVAMQHGCIVCSASCSHGSLANERYGARATERCDGTLSRGRSWDSCSQLEHRLTAVWVPKQQSASLSGCLWVLTTDGTCMGRSYLILCPGPDLLSGHAGMSAATFQALTPLNICARHRAARVRAFNCSVNAVSLATLRTSEQHTPILIVRNSPSLSHVSDKSAH